MFVSAVAPEKQIVPTARSTSSVFGQDLNGVDVPRSVSKITRQQLEDRQLFSVEQLGQHSSGTYTPGEYDLAGIPFIRGVFGELYQNGQRLLFLTNTVTPSFNQVGSLDIVKGPGSTVYGPSNRKPKWELQLNLFNFTNERNFTPVNASYTGNDMILEEKPFYITGSAKLRS